MPFLIAAAEASIRIDFGERVHGRRKDLVSRTFRQICKRRGLYPRLEDDILDAWASNAPAAKSHVAAFKEALKFRNWLAHGRYWVPKIGRKYEPSGLVQTITGLFSRIGVAGS